MAAQRTVSIRPNIEQAAETRAALEQLGSLVAVLWTSCGPGLSGLVRPTLRRLSPRWSVSRPRRSELRRLPPKLRLLPSRALKPRPGLTITASARPTCRPMVPSSTRCPAKFDPLFAASKQYEATLNEIGQAEKVGAIRAAEASVARDRIGSFASLRAYGRRHGGDPGERGDARMAPLQPALPRLLSGSWACSSFSFSARFRVASRSCTAFVQQGHQIGDVALSTGTGLSGIGTAAKGLFNAIGGLPTLLTVGVVGGIVALGAAAESQGRQLVTLREQLRATHDDYQALAVATEDAARRAAASSTLSRSAAEQVRRRSPARAISPDRPPTSSS